MRVAFFNPNAVQSHFSSKVPVKAFSTFLLISSLFAAKIFSQSAIFFYPGLSFLHISYVIFKPVIVPLFKLVHPVLHICFGVFFPDQMVSWYCVLRTVSYFCIISHFQYIQMCFLIIIIFSPCPFYCVWLSLCRVVSFLLFL